MAYYQDLREYLEALEQRGKLVRVKDPINKDTQLLPLVRLQYRGLQEEQRRAFLFENIVDSGGRRYATPVAVGVLAGSTDIYSIGMKCRPEELFERLAAAQSNPVAPRLVSNAPVQAEVHLGNGLMEHGGLAEFPIPISTPGFDPAPYITAPYWVTKDPESGVPNVGMYRAMVKSPTRTGLNFFAPSQGAAVHLRKYKARRVPMPAAIVIGGPPSLGYVAVTALTADANEFAVAGGIAGESLPLVKCKTVDLEVPANAEIVLEGEVPIDQVEPEAPFGETSGFVGLEDMNPFFNIKCITHRRQPIWLATISQHPPSEATKMRQFSISGTLYRHLKQDLKMDYVQDIGVFEEGSAGRMVAIRVGKAAPGDARRTLEATAKRYPMTKIVVVVDKDVDPGSLSAVCQAICMRTQPHRDYVIQEFPAWALGDYSLEPLDQLETREIDSPARPRASRILIDATMKWPYPPVSLPQKDFMVDAMNIWAKLGLPELKLTQPWFGVNLGYWSEEHEKYADAAVKGDYFGAGEDYAGRRRSM